MQPPNPGELFAGKYQLQQILGEGGFARVYRARDTTVGRDVAVKVLTPKDGHYPERVRKRFVREAQVLATLRSEQTITMYDFGESATGLLYMVFEYVAGVDLQTVLRRERSLPPPLVERILRQMLLALAEAHQIGVLHRDIKPANVLVFQHLDEPYRIKLIDFGIAKLFALEGRVDLTKLTSDGSVIGTPRYLAPEQFYGEDLNPAADLYSTGLVAIEMLQGTPAIVGESREEILRNQLSPEPLAVPEIAGAPHLSATLRAMTARQAADRPQSARAALRMLDGQSFSGGLPYPSGSQSAPIATAPPPRPTQSSRLAWVVGLVSAAVVLAGVVVLLRPEPEPPPIPRQVKPVSSLLRGAETESPPEPEPEPAPVVVAKSGCDRPATGMWSDATFRGIDPHQYHVWVPDRPPGERLPVVFVAHRLWGDGREFIRETRFSDAADEFGFIIISMKFIGDPDISDLAAQYMEAYEEVKARACVDESLLYGVGHAGGGRLIRQLRCKLQFSAIAATSDGQLVGETNCEAPPTPFLHIWGRDDPHMPLDGSTSCMGKKYVTVAELKKAWHRLNDCDGKVERWPSAPTGDCELSSCAAPVVSCLVKGGFDWPHAPEPIEFPGCGSPPMDFPVGRTIGTFFEEHGRPLD